VINYLIALAVTTGVGVAVGALIIRNSLRQIERSYQDALDHHRRLWLASESKLAERAAGGGVLQAEPSQSSVPQIEPTP
jgi:hypothetical protein